MIHFNEHWWCWINMSSRCFWTSMWRSKHSGKLRHISSNSIDPVLVNNFTMPSEGEKASWSRVFSYLIILYFLLIFYKFSPVSPQCMYNDATQVDQWGTFSRSPELVTSCRRLIAVGMEISNAVSHPGSRFYNHYLTIVTYIDETYATVLR